MRIHLAPAPGGRALTVILKNPSTADATHADPTVGKVEVWARRHCFAAVTFVNLFAYRSPHPHVLNTLDYLDAVGSDNDAALCQAVAGADLLIAAWGNPNGIDRRRYKRRIEETADLLRAASGPALYRVGPLTQAGHPQHGLIWRGEMELARFDLPR